MLRAVPGCTSSPRHKYVLLNTADSGDESPSPLMCAPAFKPQRASVRFLQSVPYLVVLVHGVHLADGLVPKAGSTLQQRAFLSSPTVLRPPGVPHPSQDRPSAPVWSRTGVNGSSTSTPHALSTATTWTILPYRTCPRRFITSARTATVSTNTVSPGVALASSEHATGYPEVCLRSVSASGFPTQFQQWPNTVPDSLSNLVSAGELLNHAATTGHRSQPKYYVPRNPVQTSSYYPQVPHPLLVTPGIFSQLNVDTLVYVFYYHPGTYRQYLAAKRHSEPQAITEEYEQGVYVYFDWEGLWCQRKKSDLRSEHRYLPQD
ncbi:hypothetical protein LXA43DRAFT_1100056 [Ganoderma leucocontextum]|nr:hypothetical protein LXA43DRAFT_1100056 [Ganoderma leucocontextum]